MRPNSARSIHTRLKNAVVELERAEKNAVALFAEVMRTKRYRELGHGSMHLYAAKELGFSAPKTSQFIRLAESLESLPKLKQEVTSGALPWTKAREVAKVATSQTEAAWIGVAKNTSRRELEATIATTRAEAKAERRKDRAQVALPGRRRAATTPSPRSIPTSVTLRFTPEEFARFEALVEAVRKRGGSGSREALLLGALEESVVAGATVKEARARSKRRVARSPYQVTVTLCPNCRTAAMPTSRGDAILDEPVSAAVLADCDRLSPGKRKRSAIPLRTRRTIFDRDGYRCSNPGCRNTRFLEVDHIVPVAKGGGNEPSNLRLLCAPCHRARHVRESHVASAATSSASPLPG